MNKNINIKYLEDAKIKIINDFLDIQCERGIIDNLNNDYGLRLTNLNNRTLENIIENVMQQNYIEQTFKVPGLDEYFTINSNMSAGSAFLRIKEEFSKTKIGNQIFNQKLKKVGISRRYFELDRINRNLTSKTIQAICATFNIKKSLSDIYIKQNTQSKIYQNIVDSLWEWFQYSFDDINIDVFNDYLYEILVWLAGNSNEVIEIKKRMREYEKVAKDLIEELDQKINKQSKQIQEQLNIIRHTILELDRLLKLLEGINLDKVNDVYDQICIGR